MKGRSKPKVKAEITHTEPEKRELPSNDANPPRLLILNKKIGKDATIMTFAHPRSLQPTRYYVCPESGVYEFQKLATSNPANCSWLLEPTRSDSAAVNNGDEQGPVEHGYVSKTPDIYTTTPFDPLFLLLPALAPQSASNGESAKRHFLCPDDLFEELFETSKHFSSLTDTPLKKILEARLAAICDNVDAGDMKMYRLNDDKLLKVLIAKARKVSTTGLPTSMEDKFVTRPLEKPVTLHDLAVLSSLESKESFTTSATVESQDTAASSAVDSQGSADTSITIPDTEEAQPDNFAQVKGLQRLRTALSFILSAYVPSALATYMLKLAALPSSGIDFKPLDDYLEEIARLKAEAVEASNLGNFSRKRGLDDDEVAERAEKRKKKEEEEKKRKANESRGVRDLKKVNVTGMKKMSDFFKKMPVK